MKIRERLTRCCLRRDTGDQTKFRQKVFITLDRALTSWKNQICTGDIRKSKVRCDVLVFVANVTELRKALQSKECRMQGCHQGNPENARHFVN